MGVWGRGGIVITKQYVIGVDGGGTKTRMVLGDVNGNIIVDTMQAGSNYQHIGATSTEQVFAKGFKELLRASNLQKSNISAIFLGLSGADIQSDFNTYNEVCKKVFEDIPFLVGNDAWIMMRAGLSTSYGSVVICGTGSNAATTNKQNQSAILRQLKYELGAYGGSTDIAKEAFHAAFRSNELTGEKTLLEEKLPELYHFSSIEQCIPFFYPDKIISIEQIGDATKLVFELAKLGDTVCYNLLFTHGQRLAENLIGTMKQVNAHHDEIPIVLGGTLLSFEDTPLMQGFKETVKHQVPNAYFITGTKPPVLGAYLKALDMLNIIQTDEISKQLHSYFCLS